MLLRMLVEDRRCVAFGNLGLLRKNKHGTREPIKPLGARVARTFQKLGGASRCSARIICFDMKGTEPSFGKDAVVTISGSWVRQTRSHDLKNKKCRGVPNQIRNHQLRVNGKHRCFELKSVLREGRSCVSARSQTCRRARERSRSWHMAARCRPAVHDVIDEEAQMLEAYG